MAPFPIADLPPVLLEKVISQLVKEEGYFRLQQTCRYIAEFCQYSRNINVRIRRYCEIIWETAEDGGYQLILLVGRDDKEKRLNPEVFHGTRFIAVGTPKSIANFKEFCDNLRKYRITCTDLNIEGSQVHNDLNLTKEQCTDLVKILKPEVIYIHSDESDRFEAVLHAKGLEELYLRLKPEEICHSMSKILKFPITLLYTLEVGPKTLHEIFELLLSVLQILPLEPLPDSKLFVFQLFLCADAELPSEEQLQKTFHQFDPIPVIFELNFTAGQPAEPDEITDRYLDKGLPFRIRCLADGSYSDQLFVTKWNEDKLYKKDYVDDAFEYADDAGVYECEAQSIIPGSDEVYVKRMRLRSGARFDSIHPRCSPAQQDNCGDNGVCVMKNSNPLCFCEAGFYGEHCNPGPDTVSQGAYMFTIIKVGQSVLVPYAGVPTAVVLIIFIAIFGMMFIKERKRTQKLLKEINAYRESIPGNSKNGNKNKKEERNVTLVEERIDLPLVDSSRLMDAPSVS